MNALPKTVNEEGISGRVIELFPPREDIEAAVHLPKPRPLLFDEVTETWGGYVLEAQVERGIGPFKRIEQFGFLGGAWVARASASSVVKAH